MPTFASFTLYNDYLQRNAIREDLDNYLNEMGEVTASNIQTWLTGRILLIENAAQNIAINPEPANVAGLLEQKALTSTFMASYLGDATGHFTIRPDAKMPDGFDPRVRPWYKGAQEQQHADPDRTLYRCGDRPGDHFPGHGLDESRARRGRGGRRPRACNRLVDTLSRPGFRRHGLRVPGQRRRQDPGPPGQGAGDEILGEAYPQNTPRISRDFSEIMVDGKTRIVTFTPIKGLPSVNWYIGLSVDKDKAFSMLSEFRTSAVIATVIAVAIIIALLGMLIRLSDPAAAR